MTPAELLTQFRLDMADTVEPYLWGDAEIVRGIDDAQTMFCRLTDGIPDATTPAVTTLSVVAGTEWYDVHPKIKKLRLVHREDNGRDLELVTPETASDKGIRFRGEVGDIRAIVWGLEDGKVRAWPVPSQDVTVTLNVFRLPLTHITYTGTPTPTVTGSFEIAEQHHLHLLHWVKSRAYLKQDAETFDKTKANEFEQRFRDYCAEVAREQSRSRRVTGAVTYGGL